jgi:flagellar motor protein MotB
MAKGCKKCKQEECEECPEWIFTFADLVMLMMGFFVILWVLKPTADESNPKQVAAQMESYYGTIGELRGGFGWEPDPNSSDPVDQAVIKIRARNGPGEKGKLKRPSEGAEGTDSEVTSIRVASQATVGGRILFDRAGAALRPEETAALEHIAQQIRGHRNVFLVKGHTSRDDYGDNGSPEAMMDLSIRRAQTVADFLTHRGVDPEILRVQGCSIHEPVVERAYTASQQTVNRRVEVESTSTLVEDLQDRAKSVDRTPTTSSSASASDRH